MIKEQPNSMYVKIKFSNAGFGLSLVNAYSCETMRNYTIWTDEPNIYGCCDGSGANVVSARIQGICSEILFLFFFLVFRLSVRFMCVCVCVC